MPNRHRRRPPAGSRTPLWVGLAAIAVVGLGVLTYFLVRNSKSGGSSSTPEGNSPPGAAPAFSKAVLDLDNVENTRAWAAEAVKRLKDAEARKNDAATRAEVARVEKELNDALLGKKVRWTFPVEAVANGEVKLDTFFGTDAGRFPNDDPRLGGRPMRRLYFRAFFDGDADVVRVGGEVSAEAAGKLRKGSPLTISRTVIEVMLTKHDDRWVSASSYTDVVDVLEPYCVTLVLARK